MVTNVQLQGGAGGTDLTDEAGYYSFETMIPGVYEDTHDVLARCDFANAFGGSLRVEAEPAFEFGLRRRSGQTYAQIKYQLTNEPGAGHDLPPTRALLDVLGPNLARLAGDVGVDEAPDAHWELERELPDLTSGGTYRAVLRAEDGNGALPLPVYRDHSNRWMTVGVEEARVPEARSFAGNDDDLGPAFIAGAAAGVAQQQELPDASFFVPFSSVNEDPNAAIESVGVARREVAVAAVYNHAAPGYIRLARTGSQTWGWEAVPGAGPGLGARCT